MSRQVGWTLALGILATFIATGVYGVADLLLPPGQSVAVFSVVLGVTCLSVFLLFALWKWLLKGAIAAAMRPLVERDVRAEVALQESAKMRASLRGEIGLVAIHRSFPDCEDAVKKAIASSSRIDIFVQIGKTVFSGGDFYDYLRNAKVRGGAVTRILHADKGSVFLTERAAEERGSDVASWRLDLQYSFNKAVNLASDSEKRVDARQHQEGYLWRLFVFDSVAFAQPYLFDRDNSIQAPVLELARFNSLSDGTESVVENNRSLYRVFSKYFELVWDKSAPKILSIEDLTGEDASLSVVALAKRKGRFVFAVPNRYLANRDEVLFHFPGGKHAHPEDPIGALRRETLEETGCEVAVQDYDRPTRYFIHASESTPLRIEDSVRPRLVYRRSRHTTASVNEDTTWIVGYAVDFIGSRAPTPLGELAAIIELTPEALKQAYDGSLTVGALNKMRDGSVLRKRVGLNIESDRLLTPAGVAQIVAASMYGGESDWQ